jgi:4-diphosphocytidyl-2-C-methyl-D-erythritol kinase
MIVPAPAKINLGLEVLARRADGYHDINTIFHRIGLADTVALASREHAISLSCNSPDIPTDERNLCVRAALALRTHARSDHGAHIDLFKRIPDGAGLGGGSSDAAAVLRALVQLWQLDIDERELAAIAATIGSDVPYFLRDGSAHATGRGELLTYFPLDLPYDIVVAHPGVRVPTAWAYGALRHEGVKTPTDLPAVWREHLHEPSMLRAMVRNDFEAAVCTEYPAIARLRNALAEAGADLVLMSGSGSAVFGLFASSHAAMACERSLDAPVVHRTPQVS